MRTAVASAAANSLTSGPYSAPPPAPAMSEATKASAAMMDAFLRVAMLRYLEIVSITAAPLDVDDDGEEDEGNGERGDHLPHAAPTIGLWRNGLRRRFWGRPTRGVYRGASGLFRRGGRFHGGRNGWGRRGGGGRPGGRRGGGAAVGGVADPPPRPRSRRRTRPCLARTRTAGRRHPRGPNPYPRSYAGGSPWHHPTR